MPGSSFQSVYNLANLTAPASSVTHAVKYTVLTAGGTPVTLNMQSQMDFIGPFIGQAMTVDNTANNSAVTVQETNYGWSRTVPAGVAQTFQYPAVPQQNFTFNTPLAATLTVSIYDWPAFPDSASLNGSVAAGTPVTVTNTPTVLQGTTPWITQPQPEPVTSVAGDAHAIVTGGTAVALIVGPINSGYVMNPLSNVDQGITSAAEVAWVNEVTTAGTVGNNTNCTLQPGQTYTLPPGFTGTLSANAATSGHAFTVVKR